MIKELTLGAFRSHCDTTISFSPRVTALFGPTGAGKTSIEDGIALLLAGANHSTSKDGKGIGNQVQDGADEFVLSGVFDGFSVERAVPRSGAQRLSVEGCADPGVLANQAYLNAQLGLPREVLAALLDARAVLSRDAKDQFDTLLKAIRAEELQPTKWLIEQGIKKFLGPGHLADLIKEHRTVKLRDLNREEKRLQSPIACTAANPLEDPQAPKVKDSREAYAAAQQRKDELAHLNERRAALEAEQRKLQGQLSGEVPETASGEPAADEKDYQHKLKSRIPDTETNLREANRQINQITTRIETLRREEINLRSAIQQCKDHLEVLEASRKMPECPTCGQKWPEGMKKKVLDSIKAQQETVADAEGNLKLKLHEIDSEAKQKKAVEESKQFHEESLQRYRREVAAYEAASNTRKQLNEVARKEAEHRLGEISGDLAGLLLDIEKIQGKVDNWNNFIEALRRYEGAAAEAQKQEGTRQADLRKLTTEAIPRENRIIEELEGIRDGLVENHVKPFVEIVNRYMAALGQPAMAYDLERGWVAGERGADSLSSGQGRACFEFAFRFAVAETAKFPLVLFDLEAPIDEGVQGRLFKLAYESGRQVVMTATTKDRAKVEAKFAGYPDDMLALWVGMEDGVSLVEAVRAEAVAA